VFIKNKDSLGQVSQVKQLTDLIYMLADYAIIGSCNQSQSIFLIVILDLVITNEIRGSLGNFPQKIFVIPKFH
jgi:hypothetical protein